MLTGEREKWYDFGGNLDGGHRAPLAFSLLPPAHTRNPASSKEGSLKTSELLRGLQEPSSGSKNSVHTGF